MSTVKYVGESGRKNAGNLPLAKSRRWFTLFCITALAFSGCGDTAKPVVSPAQGSVFGYFGGPFEAPGSFTNKNAVAVFDHLGGQIQVTTLAGNSTSRAIAGTFSTADTGFLAITEDFATPTNTGGSVAPQNPPLTGAWAVEIVNAGTLANLLISSPGVVSPVQASPTAMVDDSACPNFPSAAQFNFVTVPVNSTTNPDIADYGTVGIATQGSAVTFTSQPYLVGAQAQTALTSTGACSVTPIGALTTYPFNPYGNGSLPTTDLISVGRSGLLVSQISQAAGFAPGAFGGGEGILGVMQPTSAVDPSALAGIQFNGFVYSPKNGVKQNTYDITALAATFGDHTGASPSCSVLQASLAANNGQGAGTVPVLPSANAIYGGEYLITTSGNPVNDPTGATGSENCDVAIDLGTQDSVNNGLFPNATIFIGSNFPPFSATNPWNCPGVCAASFPAAAVVGQVDQKYVIFVSASAGSTPPAVLPDNSASAIPQPVGIYLFQK